MADQDQKELAEEFQRRFAGLPKVVQDAITSADVEKRMRELAEKNKLHLDQWVGLENEVMLALYGFQPAEDLQKNIKSELGISDETSSALASEVSRIVFEPIREELERELEHPEAKEKEVSGVEAAREEVLGQGTRDAIEMPPSVQLATTPPTPPVAQGTPVAPATPPPPPPTEKAVRAPMSAAYQAGEPSTARKNVHDDPYREAP